MKLRWKIFLALALIAASGALLLFYLGHRERDILQRTRSELRRQGFKTDLADFNFSTSPELRARAAALTNTDLGRSWASTNPTQVRNFSFLQFDTYLLEPVGSNAALVVWREARLPPSLPVSFLRTLGEDTVPDDLWPALRKMSGERQAALDAACQAALSGPIRFELDGSQGRNMLLRHAAILRNLSRALAVRVALNLHDQQPAEAWTNLLACTRLTTAWDPEPVDVSHLVRFNIALTAYDALWQALQFDGWSDAQLAALQREWETPDFFRGLPDTEAFTRASDADACERERQRPLSLGVPWTYIVRSPRAALNTFGDFWQRIEYRQHGSYEDENTLLLYHRDRELELRRAIQSPSWADMRGLTGATNSSPFHANYQSSAQVMMSMRLINSRVQGTGRTPLAWAAETETRRRLMVTAIALERYRLKHGVYPAALSDLAPEFLKAPPVDFMDGQPLRYHVTADGHFVLYSVGLDCVDNGGKMEAPRSPRQFFPGRPVFAPSPDSDLVWPRPATPAEAKARLDAEKKARDEEQSRLAQAQLEEVRREEQQRHSTVDRLINSKPAIRDAEPVYRGQLLRDLLRNKQSPDQNTRTIDDLLSIRQILTGQEPDIVTFEVPVNFDAVTNIGRLELLVDEDTADLSKSDGAELVGCSRSTNGNCLLVWNTGMDAPGAHAVQAQFSYADGVKRNRRLIEVKGPVTPYYSSNICQFVSERCSLSAQGAALYAKLPESNGIYSVELQTQSGAHLKTISGVTSNGVIEILWNLIDDRGQAFTNTSLSSVFHVTLPDSGRSMTQRGP